MLGVIEGECGGVGGIYTVSNETTSSMRIHSDHEEKCEVVGVPESFKALLSDFLLCGGIHQEHNQEHEMTCDASWLCVVNIDSPQLADFWDAREYFDLDDLMEQLTGNFDVDKIDVVSSGMDHRPKCHGICHLTMEPYAFIDRKEPLQRRSNDTENVA